ncbi:MAG: aminoglycoside phosphotransferase family protein, partial [Hyphomicrobiales bacterium]
MGEHAGEPDASVLDALSRMTLSRSGDTVRFTPLAGGVASDIWKVETGGRTFCVKRALARLRVRDEWLVTVERNAYEVGWIETARRLAPGSAPRILGADREANLFAMEWLPPDRFPVWKSLLMDGFARVEHARAVGETLAAIHSGTAN